MSTSLIPPAELRRLSQRLVDLQGRIDLVEKSLRATQLSHSSIEGGSLVIRDVAGLPRGYVGMQPDGTSGMRAVNGPPPPRPNTPDVVPLMAGVGVEWNGDFSTGTRPLDFSHLNVYASGAGENFISGPTNLVGTLTNAGTVPVAPVTGTYWARFVAVNTSGEESEPSFTASGTATPVVADEVLDGIITEVKLATDAVTAAKIAAGAVTETKVADNAISTPKLIAGAVETEKIAAGAVLAEKIAAGAITTEKLEALAVVADKIAANAIEAGHITAGAVTAAKLAAMLIIAGVAGGNRVQLSQANGIEQFLNSQRTLWVPPGGNAYFSGLIQAGTDAQYIMLNPGDPSTSYPRMLMIDDTSTRRIAQYYQGNTFWLRRETVTAGVGQIRGGQLYFDAVQTNVLHQRDGLGGASASMQLTENYAQITRSNADTGDKLAEVRIETGQARLRTFGADSVVRNEVAAWTGGIELISRNGPILLQTTTGSDINLSADNEVWITNAAGGLLQLDADGTVGLWDGNGGFKAFIIDHPTDPDRWLVHGCTESPDAGVEYWGTVEIVDHQAVVELPAYFDSLTRPETRQVQVSVALPDEPAKVKRRRPVMASGKPGQTGRASIQHSIVEVEVPEHSLIPRVAASTPIDNKFRVACDGPDGTKVAWLVKAGRKGAGEFNAEPLRTEIDVHGEGPYRYFTPREGA